MTDLPGVKAAHEEESTDDYAVMDRGAVVLAGERKDMVEAEVRKRLSV